MIRKAAWVRGSGVGFVVALVGASAQAGMFSMTEFVAPGEFAIGIEPEVTLSDGAGVATNVKYTQGLSDLSDFIGTIGTGTGPREFRAGGGLTFDFFPDLENQPGIGLGTQAIYYRLDTSGQLEATAIPYLHKGFRAGSTIVDPFIAVPLGFAFSDGMYHAISSLSVGSVFKASEHFSYVGEVGIGLNNTQSYLSGGIAYFH